MKVSQYEMIYIARRVHEHLAAGYNSKYESVLAAVQEESFSDSVEEMIVLRVQPDEFNERLGGSVAKCFVVRCNCGGCIDYAEDYFALVSERGISYACSVDCLKQASV